MISAERLTREPAPARSIAVKSVPTLTGPSMKPLEGEPLPPTSSTCPSDDVEMGSTGADCSTSLPSTTKLGAEKPVALTPEGDSGQGTTPSDASPSEKPAKRNRGSRNPQRDAEMRRLRLEGLSLAKIGQRFGGLSRERVRQCLQRAG